MTSDSRIRSRTGKEMLRNVNTPYSEYFLEGLTARLFTDAEFEMLKAWNATEQRVLNSL